MYLPCFLFRKVSAEVLIIAFIVVMPSIFQAGSINCETELSFCKDLGVYPRRAPRAFVYSYRSSDGGSLVEYSDDLAVKNLKFFCQEHLPRFSKRIDLSQFEVSSGAAGILPKVMLLSKKKDTPVIWRVLSGLYRNRFSFYDAEVCYRFSMAYYFLWITRYASRMLLVLGHELQCLCPFILQGMWHIPSL